MSESYQVAPTIPHNHELVPTYGAFIAQLLYNRNVNSAKEAALFLNPQWEHNYDPFLMHHLHEGVNRLNQAILDEERIAIYADYDADGVPGATVLASLLDVVGYDNYEVYLPHRHDEGYGIHLEALENIKARGATLIISIDVGITAFEAATWCKEHEIDLIITDHHEPVVDENGTQRLPESLFLINPKQSVCTYPDKMLAGSGVIFKFIQGFIAQYGEEYEIPEGWEKWLLDLVGLATLSDMVPLRNENRVLARYGMVVLKKTRRPGLRKLVGDAGLDVRYLDEEDVVFSVTPKLNAASRMSHPEDALAALRATTDLEAETTVNHLNELNNQRKTLVAQTTKEALKKLRANEPSGVIVIGSPSWQAGVLGLIASKLVEHFNMPAFVWSEENGIIKGSCRSYGGISLVELMGAADEATFIQFGGHKEAGGFSCQKNEVHFLKERLEQALVRYQENNIQEEDASITVDALLNLDDLTQTNYEALRSLAPFGVGNPKPIFLFKGVVPSTVELFGKTQNHTKVTFVTQDKKRVSAIKFFCEPENFTVKPIAGRAVDLVASFDYSVFRGRHELRLRIVDIR